MLNNTVYIRIDNDNKFSLDRFSSELKNTNFSLNNKTPFNSHHLIFELHIHENELESLIEQIIPISLCWADHKCGLVAICCQNIEVKKRLFTTQSAGKYLIFDSVDDAKLMLKKYSIMN